MTTDTDVIVVGGGPAGCIAAIVLARAGARVRLFDRATFPRDKLCGDTVNPGCVALLGRLGLSDAVAGALRIEGMRITGEAGVAIEARYPDGLCGRALVRRAFDAALLRQAAAAGVAVETGVPVRRPIVDAVGDGPAIGGVVVGRERAERSVRAEVTIGADGRRSALAFGLGLARHPAEPRRWATGAYYEQVAGVGALGEMHVRRGRYIGIAPLPGGIANVCVVKPFAPGDAQASNPSALLASELMRDQAFRDRFAAARLVAKPAVLGPLAVDVSDAALRGLLLAGDAAGFIDPMTGDGLRFALRGGELAAIAALDALANGWTGVHERFGAARRREFGSKWRFNRALRALVASPAAVRGAALAARLTPGLVRRIAIAAGDCGVST